MLRYSETQSLTVNERDWADDEAAAAETDSASYSFWISPRSKQVQALVGIIALTFQIISVSSFDWVHTENGRTGLFLYQTGSKVQILNCDSMNQTECGYLTSSQTASVIAIIFAGFATILLFYQYWQMTVNTSLVTACATFFQCIFCILSVVVYSYFKGSYLESDDGVNVEYPVDTYSNYLFAFYIWISATVLSFILWAANTLSVIAVGTSISKKK